VRPVCSAAVSALPKSFLPRARCRRVDLDQVVPAAGLRPGPRTLALSRGLLDQEWPCACLLWSGCSREEG
jgi:hypothetical protein